MLRVCAADADKAACPAAERITQRAHAVFGPVENVAHILPARDLKRGEALLDQPWRRPDAAAARRLNEAVNLRLYDLFAEAAA